MIGQFLSTSSQSDKTTHAWYLRVLCIASLMSLSCFLVSQVAEAKVEVRLAAQPTETESRAGSSDLKNRSAYSPYWYVDNQTDSFIEVKNLLNTTLILQAKLTTISGQSVDMEPLELAPRATQRFDLRPLILLNATAQVEEPGSDIANRWGDGSRPYSQVGSAQLSAISPKEYDAESFSAWIIIENPEEGLGFVAPFHRLHARKEVSATLEGLWWFPYGGTQAYFALQNASAQAVDVQLEMFSGGETIKSTNIRLDASAFALANVRQLLGTATPPNIGGVKFRYSLPPEQQGQIMVRGFLVQEEKGFSTPLHVYEYRSAEGASDGTELHAPVAYFGKLDELVPKLLGSLSPHLLLRNTAERDITVHVELYGRDERDQPVTFRLRPVTLKPESPIDLNLATERKRAQTTLADGVAGLRLIHDGKPSEVLSELINVSETGRLTLYDRMRTMQSFKVTNQAAISFNLKRGRQSFLILKNTTDKPQQPRVLIDYLRSEQPYEVAIAEIPPQQVAVVDIQQLRDAQVLDLHGQIIPRSVSYGGARILSEPGAIVASDPTFYFLIDELSGFRDGYMSVSCMWIPLAPDQNPGGGGGGSSPRTCTKILMKINNTTMKTDDFVVVTDPALAGYGRPFTFMTLFLDQTPPGSTMTVNLKKTGSGGVTFDNGTSELKNLILTAKQDKKIKLYGEKASTSANDTKIEIFRSGFCNSVDLTVITGIKIAFEGIFSFVASNNDNRSIIGLDGQFACPGNSDPAVWKDTPLACETLFSVRNQLIIEEGQNAPERWKLNTNLRRKIEVRVTGVKSFGPEVDLDGHDNQLRSGTAILALPNRLRTIGVIPSPQCITSSGSIGTAEKMIDLGFRFGNVLGLEFPDGEASQGAWFFRDEAPPLSGDVQTDVMETNNKFFQGAGQGCTSQGLESFFTKPLHLYNDQNDMLNGFRCNQSSSVKQLFLRRAGERTRVRRNFGSVVSRHLAVRPGPEFDSSFIADLFADAASGRLTKGLSETYLQLSDYDWYTHTGKVNVGVASTPGGIPKNSPGGVEYIEDLGTKCPSPAKTPPLDSSPF